MHMDTSGVCAVWGWGGWSEGHLLLTVASAIADGLLTSCGMLLCMAGAFLQEMSCFDTHTCQVACQTTSCKVMIVSIGSTLSRAASITYQLSQEAACSCVCVIVMQDT